MKIGRPIDALFALVAAGVIVLLLSNPETLGGLLKEPLGGGGVTYAMDTGPPVGAEALELIGTSIDGETIRLSDFRGKAVFLYFWAHT